MGTREAWRFWWRYGAGTVMWFCLAVCVSQLVPTWSAHLSHGQAGTWTVTRVACGRGSCNEVGRFVSSDGADVRTEVNLSGGSVLTVGQATPAVDTGGDSVYPPGGGHAWVTYIVGTAMLTVLCAIWLRTFPLAVLRRRRAERESSVHAGPADCGGVRKRVLK